MSRTDGLDARLQQLVEVCIARGPRNPAEDIQRLSVGFGEERSSRRADYMNDPALRAAYLGFFVPQYAAKIAGILRRCEQEGHLRLPERPRVLDVGAGPLSGTLGAWLACGAVGPSSALDLSRRSMDAGLEVLRAVAPHSDVHLVEASLQRRPLPPGPFDLIIVAHVLNELGDPRRSIELRVDLLKALCGVLAKGGRLLVVEPGTRVHGRALMAVRDRLGEAGVSIHAPCAGAKRCPMLKTPGDWCHSEELWQAPPAFQALERSARLSKSVLKHSYLLLSREPARSHGLRLVGGVMHPKGRGALRYACGVEGIVTLELQARHLAPAADLHRGALFELDAARAAQPAAVTPASARPPSAMPSSDRGAAPGRRGDAKRPAPRGVSRGDRRRR